jgi:hypothetical protein
VTTNPASPRGSGPTGTVEFWLNSVPTAYATTPAAPGAAGLLGSANVTQRGTAVLGNESSPLPAGADTVYAVYYGDANFAGSQGSASLTVNAASTHTVVYASPNPGVAGASVTFTAVVNDAAPNWENNGGTITPPSGTVSFLVNGFTESAATGATITFVGDSGNSAIYTYTTTAPSSATTPTQSDPLTVGSNSVGASFVATAGSNYTGSSSRNNVSYQVVSAAAAGTGTITTNSATTAGTATLKGGQTLSITGTATSVTSLTYADSANGIKLASTTINAVVFSSNGTQAEISGTGTNNGSTNVNFILFLSTVGGRSGQPTVSLSIVGNTPPVPPATAGLLYNQSGSLASGSTLTITNVTGGTTIPPGGGLPGAHDQVLGSWPGDGGAFGGGFGGWHQRRR